ncbi:uroporphyrinogen-III synthase [Alkalihalobacillus trypoxylicola]|uniref:Uroporphyrinogen-III synthase n=1 Tax=Alkalihalobacillus trypoxylicola TaxID=519424 RepID=A0A162F5J1_9BACI|nr:uroporphyrinogen-III synthase [Alkalihalobacillus trypoxylicola]KYG34835.1 uroporphyrinogen-III synthase [Alkalihalobacillus trypoxylicola]
MSKPLEGKQVVLTASRKTEEMTTLINKQGGEVKVFSLQGTVFLDHKDLENDIKLMIENQYEWLILTTGMGTKAIVDAAESIDLKEALLDAWAKTNLVARGYKTIAALKELGLIPKVTDEDGTIRGLISALKNTSFSNQKVAVQLHGLHSPALTSFLENKGAIIHEIYPYKHLPAEREQVEQLFEQLEKGKVDAICFTTYYQVRCLFEYAVSINQADVLRKWFNHTVIAVAVGKVTAEELREWKVERIISPKHERMGAMIVTLSQYVKSMTKLV